MALAKGVSRIECGPISLHTKTAVHIAQTLTKVCQLFAFYATPLLPDLNVLYIIYSGWSHQLRGCIPNVRSIKWDLCLT